MWKPIRYIEASNSWKFFLWFFTCIGGVINLGLMFTTSRLLCLVEREPLVNSRTRHIDFDQLRSLSVIFLAFLNADA